MDLLGFPGLPGGAEWLVIFFFCGLPILALVLGIIGFLHILRKRAVDNETRCRRCGQILRGISEPRCPECGERI